MGNEIREEKNCKHCYHNLGYHIKNPYKNERRTKGRSHCTLCGNLCHGKIIKNEVGITN